VSPLDLLQTKDFYWKKCKVKMSYFHRNIICQRKPNSIWQKQQQKRKIEPFKMQCDISIMQLERFLNALFLC